jgi:myo-inositol-1-phosphate synthase
MGSVRVAIVGVGNCASSLVQGVEYYKDADPAGTVPGLMHVKFGEYHVNVYNGGQELSNVITCANLKK